MKNFKNYKGYALYILLALVLCAGCNDTNYMDAYEKGFNDATKQQKKYFEFKNVPYCADTVITYSSSDINYDYRMLIITNNDSADIKLKLYSKALANKC